MLSDLIKNPKKDREIYTISNERHTKRVTTSKLLQKLKEYGYNDFTSRHSYIQFTQKSPIDFKKFQKAVKQYYKNKYTNINIKKVDIRAARYTTQLPKNFTIHFPRKAYLSHKNIFYIKTLNNRKIFFNYTILATLNVYKAKGMIKKGSEISLKNTEKKSIILEKFRAFPLIKLEKSKYQAKHRIKGLSLITQRDIVRLYLVKRGTTITVTIHDGGVSISFFARALKSGRFGDTISVLHTNNKKIRVRITGRNRAEVE